MTLEDRASPVTPSARHDRELHDRIADDVCQKDLLRASRKARRLRLHQTVRHAQLEATGNLLEVGCGAGFTAEYLRGLFASYHGIDHSRKMVELARAVNGGPNTTFETVDATDFAGERRFDLILMIGVLHHLSDPETTLRHLAEFLSSEGVVAVNEPQSGNPLIQLARSIRKRTDSAYSDEQLAFGATELSTLMTGAGLELVKLLPQGYFTTPFAEITAPAQRILSPLCTVACSADRALETIPWRILRPVAWNLVAVARRSEDSPPS